jgi:hypothetical protein
MRLLGDEELKIVQSAESDQVILLNPFTGKSAPKKGGLFPERPPFHDGSQE